MKKEFKFLFDKFLENAEKNEKDIKVIWCKNCETVQGFIIGAGDDLIDGQGFDKNDLSCSNCFDNASMMSDISVLIKRWSIK